jgi:hypothetical protein
MPALPGHFSMTPFAQQHVLDTFREMPGHRGCAESELTRVEQELGVALPPFYRAMMLLDATRLYNIDVFLRLAELRERREQACDLLLEDGHEFELAPEHVVFAWDDIYAFYFFTAVGRDDVPVLEFSYYSPNEDGLPSVAYDSLPEFFAERLKEYLRL